MIERTYYYKPYGSYKTWKTRPDGFAERLDVPSGLSTKEKAKWYILHAAETESIIAMEQYYLHDFRKEVDKFCRKMRHENNKTLHNP